MMKQPVIEVCHLNHYYSRGRSLQKQVLFDVNLTIAASEIVIMTGPSGSGKTTLLSLIGCLRSVQEGNLKLVGQELHGASPHQLVQARRKLGYIFQAHNLLEFLTAQQNVQMPLELHAISAYEASARAEAMLAEVGLAHQANDYPDSLSGGQKQRVAIARALVSHPQVVLADEPTASLDKQSGREVVELMQKLAKEQGSTILLVTHDNRILDIADRLVHMEDGNLKEEIMLEETNLNTVRFNACKMSGEIYPSQ